MYKVEYLILLDNDKTRCKTVKALKSLLQADSDINIEKNKVTHKKYTTSISVKLGKKDDASHLFFNISLKCDSEEDIEKFSKLLKAIRSSFSLVTKTHYVIWDDLSLFYAQKAYPIIFDIENLMRLLITKFMLTNIGVGWTKDRVPTDVQQSVNPNNKDINYLNNVDFIQLKNFLFSENYPNHKESLIKELKNAKDFSNLDLEEIKSLLPESNWDKFFEPIVGCDAEYLKKRWDKLYELRCKVAHNKSFNKNDLEEVKKLVSELKPHLEKALGSLDEIVINEEERENVAENVVINMHKAFGGFIMQFRQLEKILNSTVNHPNLNPDKRKLRGFGNQTGFLREKGIITEKQYKELKRIFYTRNKIVHPGDLSLTIRDIAFSEK
ncbi:MAG: hypothetical protein AAGG68_26790, partial [Bacteroidota bacterium]